MPTIEDRVTTLETHRQHDSKLLSDIHDVIVKDGLQESVRVNSAFVRLSKKFHWAVFIMGLALLAKHLFSDG